MRNTTLCLSFLLLQQAHAAGFDCSKASSQVEKLICSESELSELDDKMSVMFKSWLDTEGADPYFIKDEQRQWLKFQRDTCPDANCIGREYEERLAEGQTSFFPDTEADENRTPQSQAYGKFEKASKIEIYVSESEGTEKSEVTQSVNIYKVQAKPRVAIIDINLTFDNAHTCDFADQAAVWSENHWLAGDEFAEDSCQLRLYPANGEILLSDPDHTCNSFCGRRGYFDGIALKHIGDIKP